MSLLDDIHFGMEGMELGVGHPVCAGDCLALHTSSAAVLLGFTSISWRGWCRQQVGAQMASSAGISAEPAAVQQRLQRARLSGWRLAAEAGATALSVDTARLALAQRARHAAATAWLAHQLGARGRCGRRRALGQRTRIAWLTAHNGARAYRASACPRHWRSAEQGQCGQRSGPECGARPMHGAHREGLLLNKPEHTGIGRQKVVRGCGI